MSLTFCEAAGNSTSGCYSVPDPAALRVSITSIQAKQDRSDLWPEVICVILGEMFCLSHTLCAIYKSVLIRFGVI